MMAVIVEMQTGRRKIKSADGWGGPILLTWIDPVECADYARKFLPDIRTKVMGLTPDGCLTQFSTNKGVPNASDFEQAVE